jgi:hypothetical protein
MAENVSKGSITISKAETGVAILVSTLSFIQVPIKNGHPNYRVFLSKHGDINETWMSLTQDSIMYIKPPFYVYSLIPVTISGMEA